MINIERFNGFFALGVLALCLSMLGSTSDPSVLGTDGAVRAAPNGEDAPLAEPLACQFEIRARNTLERDVWVLFPKSKVKRPNRIGAQTRYLEGGMQDQRIRPGERMNERYEAKGGCGALRRWTFMVRIGPSGRSPILYLLATTYDETDRRIDLGESACWLESIRDGELEVAAGRYGCEAERTSARQPLEGADNTNTTEEATDQSEGSVDVHLNGTWLRRDSNNPRNNGMRISVRGDRATLTAMPPTGSQRFRTGQVLWQDLANDGTVRVRGSDGGYYPAHVKMEGPDRLHIDIDHNGPGNDQTWERAGPSIDGDWVLVEATDGENEGLRVRVDGSQATARFVPSTASRSFRVGARAWRDIGSGDQPQLGKLEALSDGREYGTAQFRLLDENRLRVVFDAGGTVQLWARPGVAEELRAARERDESLAEGPQPWEPVDDPLAQGGDLEQPTNLPELDIPEDPTPPVRESAPAPEQSACVTTSLQDDRLDLAWDWGLTIAVPQSNSPVSVLPRYKSTSTQDDVILDLDPSQVSDLGGRHLSYITQASAGGRRSEAEVDLTSGEYHAKWEAYDEQGYRPSDVEAYQTDNGMRYAGVWVSNSEDIGWWSRRNMTETEYRQTYTQRLAAGYRLVDLEAYATPDGIKYAAIWYESCDDKNWTAEIDLDRDNYQQKVEELESRGFQVIDFESYRSPSGQQYAAIWEKIVSPREWQVRSGRPLEPFLNYHRRYIDEGYRLIDYESYETSGGLRYAGVWAENDPRYRYSAKNTIDDTIIDYRLQNDLPGISVVIIQDGDIIYRRGFGFADLGANKEAYSETVYLTASVSKAIGATLAAKLEADLESLDLTNPTADYLGPALQYMYSDPPSIAAVCDNPYVELDELDGIEEWQCEAIPDDTHTHTVEQLLSKTACVWHYPEGPEPENRYFRWRAEALDQIWDSGLLPNCIPGRHYRYSTHGFTFVGAVLEAVTGRNIAELIEDELAAPLDLPSMRAMYSEDGNSGFPPNYDRAQAYWLTNNNMSPDNKVTNPNTSNNPNTVAPRENASWKVLGGGIEMHAVDLARFGWMLLNGEIVSTTTLNNRLWSSLTDNASGYNTVAPSSVGAQGNIPNGVTGIGMAWEMGGTTGNGNGRWVRHGGDARRGGAGSFLKIFRDSNIVIAMLSNRTFHNNRFRNSLMDRLATIVTGATPP